MKTIFQFRFFCVLLLVTAINCGPTDAQVLNKLKYDPTIRTGADQTEDYLHLLKDKRVAIVANQTSRIGETHLVDTLLSLDINVVKVFAPEHGFRGDAAAGETVKSGFDDRTGLPVISLYGKDKKPTAKMLADVDLIVFDIQDVGARFYTYISTMHYAMKSAVENDKGFIVLDRPNPNGFYVDGPVLEEKYKSFVGMHPIPVVHGLTVGELAHMINGEGWLKTQDTCDLKVIPCKNYEHSDLYKLPVKPSPNLPNMASIYLYPSLCFFEPTAVSVGRGTEKPFQLVGYPDNPEGNVVFTPQSIAGVVENPKHEQKECTGSDLEEFGSFYFFTSRKLYLQWIVGFYELYPEKEKFFTNPEFFDKLAGNSLLRQQIENNVRVEEIRNSWLPALDEFKIARKKYLLYPDFE